MFSFIEISRKLNEIQNRGWRKFCSESNVWKKQSLLGKFVPLRGRFGHTATLYKNTIIYFGGETDYNPRLKCRDCLNELWSFDCDTLQWSVIRTQGPIIEHRRNHAACTFGRYFVVSGGIDNTEHYVCNFYFLNLGNRALRTAAAKPPYLSTRARARTPTRQLLHAHQHANCFTRIHTHTRARTLPLLSWHRGAPHAEHLAISLAFWVNHATVCVCATTCILTSDTNRFKCYDYPDNQGIAFHQMQPVFKKYLPKI